MRCVHESQLHQDNCFITLTFSNEHLPENYSVNVRDWQLFMKRFRKKYPNKKLRSFACGEYGETNLRPHYHAIIFGHDFNDKVPFKKSPSGEMIYTSPTLAELWPFGHSSIGNVTFESAAYVARYVMKKITGNQADDHYTRQHPVTGKLHRVQPEFVTQSRRPGLGAPWLERFKSDVYPSDFVIVRGQKMRPPKFYDRKLTEEEIEKIKRRRMANGLKHREDNTPPRLQTREIVQQARVKMLKRKLED